MHGVAGAGLAAESGGEKGKRQVSVVGGCAVY